MTFPIPTTLRTSLLDRLHSHLAQHLPHSAAARFLHATRNLSSELEGEELVDALRETNDVLLKGIRAQHEGSAASDTMRRELGGMYASWVEEWIEKLDEENLVSLDHVIAYGSFTHHYRFASVNIFSYRSNPLLQNFLQLCCPRQS